MNNLDQFRIKITGYAGDGVITAGTLIMKAALSSGYYASVYKNIPSSIRSGISSVIVTISNQPIISTYGKADACFVIHTDSVEDLVEKEKKASIIICDTNSVTNENLIVKTLKPRIIMIPIDTILKEKSLSDKFVNSIVFGAICKCLDFEIAMPKTTAANYFANNTDSLIKNMTALESGYEWAENNNVSFDVSIQIIHRTKGLCIDGNSAIGLGAIVSGCTFFASYPITPATSIGDYLAKVLPDNGGVVYQAEDEIAAIAAVAGASFSGCKSMTATSGPGLSLMQEMIGYLSMTEIPAVIIDVMRPGPSTGMPTKHSQDDLMAAVFGGHGEDQRIVLAPISFEDCYYLTIEAFGYAEKYNCPVILLNDYGFAMSENLVPVFTLDKTTLIDRNNNDKIPETKQITGLEYELPGIPTENPDIRNRQMKRRAEKLNQVMECFVNQVIWDCQGSEADVAIIAWGFNVLAVREAINELRSRGLRIAALFPRMLYPVNKEVFTIAKKKYKNIVVVESNYTGQYANLIRMYTGLETKSLLKYDGEPFTCDEIIEQLKEIVDLSENNEKNIDI
jgi:2-oxoglutarate ferredoxin oxidoreductase subunit alpha